MAVTGELNDLSLAELIEFFCNQRKTGCLTVAYPHGEGHFYLQSGSVVHAEVGVLCGVEAVFYALTLPNASFTFAAGLGASQETINQPWISVVLEGLRRIDEGVQPQEAFSAERPPVEATTRVEATASLEVSPLSEVRMPVAPAIEAKPSSEPVPKVEVKPVVAVAVPISNEPGRAKPDISHAKESTLPLGVPEKIKPEIATPGFLLRAETASKSSYAPWKLSMIFAAVIAVIAVVAVPWSWYARGRGAKTVNESTSPSVENPVQASQPVSTNEPAVQSAPDNSAVSETASEAVDVARQQREARSREEARARIKAADNAAALSSPTPTAANPRPTATNQSGPATARKVTVQVTYDENGRVTQASGGDATALRIARQKRFPAGKAGSATITIPIN